MTERWPEQSFEDLIGTTRFHKRNGLRQCAAFSCADARCNIRYIHAASFASLRKNVHPLRAVALPPWRRTHFAR